MIVISPKTGIITPLTFTAITLRLTTVVQSFKSPRMARLGKNLSFHIEFFTILSFISNTIFVFATAIE